MPDKENLDPMMFRVFNEIGIIQQLATAKLEKGMPLGIKTSQFAVLNHMVKLGDGSTHQKLTSAFQVTKGAMTNNLNRLQEKELIRIEPDEHDGRIKRIFLTDLGRKTRTRALNSVEQHFELLKKEFGDEAFESILPFLSRLRTYLDANR